MAVIHRIWGSVRGLGAPFPVRRIEPFLTFFFVWTLLPNLAFLSIWITGGPIRTPTIVLYLLVGLAATRLPLILVFMLYIPVLALDVLWLISGIFNLSPVSTVRAIEYLGTIQPFASATYAAFVAAVAVSAIAMFYCARRWRSRWRAVSLSGACVGVLFIMVADVAINLTPEYKWGRFYRATAPFDSAMRNAGLSRAELLASGRDLFIVMVESWGELADPELKKLVRAPLRHEGVRKRYAVTSGTSVYYGSTTSAEFRELCDRWAEFADYLEVEAPECLPAQLRAVGYETVAFHGFTGRMFDRHRWYPNVGFQKAYFREHLETKNLRMCEGVYGGICDVDLAGLVGRALVDADGAPRLVYWLTLNSHLPIDPKSDVAFLDCGGPADPFAQKQVCVLADQWMQVFERVADIVTRESLRPVDVLLVGDHAPPFWSREGKAFFVRGKVPWILLRPRADVDWRSAGLVGHEPSAGPAHSAVRLPVRAVSSE